MESLKEKQTLLEIISYLTQQVKKLELENEDLKKQLNLYEQKEARDKVKNRYDIDDLNEAFLKNQRY